MAWGDDVCFKVEIPYAVVQKGKKWTICFCLKAVNFESNLFVVVVKTINKEVSDKRKAVRITVLGKKNHNPCTNKL